MDVGVAVFKNTAKAGLQVHLAAGAGPCGAWVVFVGFSEAVRRGSVGAGGVYRGRVPASACLTKTPKSGVGL
jgi:hypothetical protein